MALVNLSRMLQDARENSYAVANFTLFNEEMMRGTVLAAEALRAPVIVAYAEVFEALIPMELFMPMLLEQARAASVPVAVHLDHARSIDYVKKAIDNGFTSIMIDASDLPLEENIKTTQAVVTLCEPHSISVEAELGYVGGLDGYSYEGDGYTSVEEAIRFTQETGVNALAVSVGTVHGVYKSEPVLQLERLAELKAAIDTPLVLHGGSGLSDQDFRNVIAGGIAKLNIYTDLMLRAAEEMKGHESKTYLDKCIAAAGAIQDESEKKIRLFGSDGKA